MKLIYTTRTKGFEPGKKYRNPRFFAGPEKGTAAVIIEGNWPEVEKAYKAIEADVKVVDVKAKDATSKDEDPERPELEKAYEAQFGKPPAGNMKTENIRKKLEEAKQ